MNHSPLASSFSARGISVKLGSNRVLNNLDLPDLQAGQVVALLGPNGCGKSTLLKGLSGIVPATIERLQWGGTDLRPMNATARSQWVRYLPQALSSDVHLTAAEAVLVALNARQAPARRAALAQALGTLASLGIAHLGSRYLDELSGGQKQLVALAQALSHQPKALLLDEPLAALDLNHQHHVMRLLKRLAQERQLLIVIVLHDLNIALRYADNALLMRDGTLTASGKPERIITAQSLADTFSIQARVESCSQGLPYVLVDDLIRI